VPRPRLVERLNEGLGHKLVLVSAPAGYGKTTLLSAWIAQVREAQARSDRASVQVAWLSLDQEDDDATRFWAYLVAALQTAHPDLGQEALQFLGAPQRPPVQSVLTSLLNDAAVLSQTIVLVLDDYHVVTSQEIHNGIAFLLDHLPRQLHLVLATRADPPLPIHRLRARGHLTELRADDLRFTADEAIAFLNGAMGLGLLPEEAKALETRTEGWIVGLQLVALSLEGRADIHEFIAAFTGSHHYVLEYLSEEVLRRQPTQVQGFLLQTSILDRLCGPLCDAVLDWPANIGEVAAVPMAEGERRGAAGGAGSAILEHLRRGNLFVTPLDDAHYWYRYHHLFADLLGNRLRQEMPQKHILELHRRASVWHAAHGLVREAVKHALSAQDYEQAAGLIERDLLVETTDLDVTVQMAWIQALPEDEVRSRPMLSITQAWGLFFAGKIDSVESWLQAAERRVQAAAEELPDGERSPGQAMPNEALRRNVLGSAAALRAFIADRRGDVSRATKLARAADETLPPDDVMARSIVPYVLGRAHRLGGDLAQASQACAEMVRIGRAAGNVLTIAMGLCELASVRKIQGQLGQAADLYREALELASGRDNPQIPLVAVVDVGLSDLLLERNDLEAARQRAQQVVDNLEHMQLWGMPTDLALVYTTLARVLQAQGDDRSALDVLEQAKQAERRYVVLPEFGRLVDMCRVWVWLAQGSLPEALRWASSVSTHRSRRGPGDVDEHSPLLIRERTDITLARVLIAQGRTETDGSCFDEALQLLTRLASMAESGGRNGRLIEILVLQAKAHYLQGDVTRGLAALEKSFVLAEEQGYERVYLDEGKVNADLLRVGTARRVWSSSCFADYASRLLQAHDSESNNQQPTTAIRDAPQVNGPSPLVEPLTGREMEVLHLIAAGCSNQEIAQELVITLSTVKKHTGNIYGKLGVSSRTQAISRAHQLGLIAPGF